MKTPSLRFQPQQLFLIDGWRPASFVDDVPIAYATMEEARADLREYIDDCQASGIEAPSAEDLRIQDLATNEVFPYLET